MNNLKFRVWDKIFKKLTEIAYIDLLKKEITYYKTSNYCYTEIVRDFDDYEIMSSTGFKDKNGTEIFIGDILTDEGEFEEDSWDYGEVIFDKENFDCFVKWSNAGFKESIVEGHNYIIAGNIYENKELIKNEQS